MCLKIRKEIGEDIDIVRKQNYIPLIDSIVKYLGNVLKRFPYQIESCHAAYINIFGLYPILLDLELPVLSQSILNLYLELLTSDNSISSSKILSIYLDLAKYQNIVTIFQPLEYVNNESKDDGRVDWKLVHKLCFYSRFIEQKGLLEEYNDLFEGIKIRNKSQLSEISRIMGEKKNPGFNSRLSNFMRLTKGSLYK